MGARFLADGCLLPFEAADRSPVRRLRPFLPQLGQPGQRTRFPMTASHSWPHPEHCHQAFCFLEKLTSDGVRSPFRLGCHSAATCGHRSARELPALGTACAVRAQCGHDDPCWGGRQLVFATRVGTGGIATTPSCCSHNQHRKASDRRCESDANRPPSRGTSRPATRPALGCCVLSPRRCVRRLDSHARGYGLRLAFAIHAGTSSRPTRPSACCRVQLVPVPELRSECVPTRPPTRDTDRQASQQHRSVWRPAHGSAR
jgi:hypothetical protein